ncbi:fibronectin type III domain-containing protein [Eubacterium xylanophilum]|uniref:fibronectin type III domain-containing protein n=1 Tax=Eubacterium xylanophilum TaxID=39497 RepID=UPI00047B7826|nr:fibronectin type III domain-containing protein [Eubacterium xylanophilum]
MKKMKKMMTGVLSAALIGSMVCSSVEGVAYTGDASQFLYEEDAGIQNEKVKGMYGEAKNALGAAKTKVDGIDGVLKTAKANFDASTQRLTELREEKQKIVDGQAKAREDLSVKKEEQNKLQSEKPAKREAADAALTAVEKAETDLETAKDELGEAKVQFDKGSRGFFETVGATGALNALDREGKNNLGADLRKTDSSGKEFSSYTQNGEKDDATNLDNMKESLEMIKKANLIRKNENYLTACNSVMLKVSDTLMAMSQSNANWSDQHLNHASSAGSNYNIGENIAWNYGSDPFIQWYDEEKNVYIEMQENLDLDGDGQVGSSDTQTGHYTNLCNAGYKTTGFAICTRGSMHGWNTYAQSFSNASYNGETVYSVSDYYDRFMEYYDNLTVVPEEKVSVAEGKVESAKDASQDAEAEYQAVVDNIAKVAKEISEIQSAITAYNVNSGKYNKSISEEEDENERLEGVVADYTDKYAAAVENYNTKLAAYENAKKAYVEAFGVDPETGMAVGEGTNNDENNKENNKEENTTVDDSSTNVENKETTPSEGNGNNTNNAGTDASTVPTSAPTGMPASTPANTPSSTSASTPSASVNGANNSGAASNDINSVNSYIAKPGKAKIKSAKNRKKKTVVVKWKKVNGAKGYQIRYALNKKLTKKKKSKITVKTSCTIKKLTKKKKYYIRVRAFKVAAGKKRIYGSWSAVKKVKIKK